MTESGGFTTLARRFLGLFGALALAMSGIGLTASVLGLRAEHEGYATTVTSAIMAMYYVGFLGGTRLAVWAMPRFGHVRTFGMLALGNALAPLLQGLFIDPVAWGVLRCLTGLSIAGIYVVSESWINQLATNETRGRLMALYLVVMMSAVAGGQLLLNVGSVDGYVLFGLCGVLFALAAVPLLVEHPEEHGDVEHESLSILEVFRLVPSGMLTCALSGIITGGMYGMGAVYGSRAGLDKAHISYFLSIGTLGVFLAWPISGLSDRQPRRHVVVAVSGVGALCAGLMLATTPGAWTSYLVFFAMSGCGLSLYSLSVAYTNDWLAPEQRVAASSSLVVSAGLGSILGPLLIGWGMSTPLDERGFFVAMIAAFTSIVGFVGYRIVTAPDVATSATAP